MSHPEVPTGPAGLPPAKETRLEARALRQRWDLPAAVRNQVLQRLASICDPDHVHEGADADGNPTVITPKLREVISAAGALIAADLQSERNRLLAAKLALERARFAWQQQQAAPDDSAGDDYIIDLSPPDDPAQPPDGPAA